MGAFVLTRHCWNGWPHPGRGTAGAHMPPGQPWLQAEGSAAHRLRAPLPGSSNGENQLDLHCGCFRGGRTHSAASRVSWLMPGGEPTSCQEPGAHLLAVGAAPISVSHLTISSSTKFPGDEQTSREFSDERKPEVNTRVS